MASQGLMASGDLRNKVFYPTLTRILDLYNPEYDIITLANSVVHSVAFHLGLNHLR